MSLKFLTGPCMVFDTRVTVKACGPLVNDYQNNFRGGCCWPKFKHRTKTFNVSSVSFLFWLKQIVFQSPESFKTPYKFWFSREYLRKWFNTNNFPNFKILLICLKKKWDCHLVIELSVLWWLQANRKRPWKEDSISMQKMVFLKYMLQLFWPIISSPVWCMEISTWLVMVIGKNHHSVLAVTMTVENTSHMDKQVLVSIQNHVYKI